MKYFIFAFSLFVSLSSNAAHHCKGKVVNVDIAGGGNLHANIAGIGDGNVFCNIKSKLGEYEPESCRAILSLFMAAKMADKNIRVYFRNDENKECNKGNWGSLADLGHGFYYTRLED
jgi:hypothetical protein